MNSILRFVKDMLPYMLVACPLLVIWRLAAVRLYFPRRGLRTTMQHEVGTILLFMVLIGLASQTIFLKLDFTDAGLNVTGLSTGAPQINLIPFRVLYENYQALFVDGKVLARIINFLGNIVIFMPIGFFVPLLYRRMTAKRTAFIAFCISLSIELIQIPLDRWTDIDDLWLNTLGAVLGYGVFWLVQRLAPKLVCSCKVTERPLLPKDDGNGAALMR